MTEASEAARERVRVSIRWKMVALCALAMALGGAVALVTVVIQSRRVLMGTVQEQGAVVAHQLAGSLGFAVESREVSLLRASAENAIRENPKLLYVVWRDAAGATIVASRAPDAAEDAVAALDRATFVEGSPVAHRSIRLGDEPVLEVAERVAADALPGDAPKFLGSVQVGLRSSLVQAAIVRIVLNTAAVALLVFLLCLGGAYAAAGMITRPLARLTRAAAGIAQGDLRQEVATRGNDEISELAGSFQAMSAGLRGIAVDLQRAAADVVNETGRISATATQQAAMSAQQASAIAETSTTIAEIAQTSKQATENADAVIGVAHRSEELSREGERAVEQAEQGIAAVAEQVREIAVAITRLSAHTLKIGEIIATVKDVAEQSNVLALNAAIEASKAGEHGRGFAVLAAEMRKLAEQSRAAASQVRVILGEIQGGTRIVAAATEEGRSRAQAAIALAHTAGQSIVGLAQVIRESTAAARQIADSARQQTLGIDQIVAAMGDVSGAMNEAVEGTRQIEQVTTNLDTVSRRLSAMVARYRV